jgi:hypothetical protein
MYKKEFIIRILNLNSKKYYKKIHLGKFYHFINSNKKEYYHQSKICFYIYKKIYNKIRF